jgi:4-hydroxybenzoate polyprenyltransferase
MPLSDVGPQQSPPKVICVDLDGTLVRTDTLVEATLKLLRSPRNWLRVLVWVTAGRASFKRRVTAHAPLDVARLPYESSLIDYLRHQRASGRRLVLATAADQGVADRINLHLELFDEVLASDGVRNLKGAVKADLLAERFGVGAFSYVGNSWPDLHVWRRAGSAVIVNAPARLATRVSRITPVEHQIDTRPFRLFSLLKALRPHQWLKNFLVLLPIVTANALRDTGAWVGGLAMFLAFCATASAIYVVNDLTDLDADRAHPRKRRRPFASADLPVIIGVIIAPGLLGFGLALGLSVGAVEVIAAYALSSLLYSFWLKELPLVDIFTLAFLYTVRLYGGGEASGYRLSPWLLACSIFLFLGLSTIKRVAELMDLRRTDLKSSLRRGYRTDDIGILQTMGVAASFVSATVLALFVQSDSVAARYSHPEYLWIVVPLLLFWQCRLWLATTRGYMHDDPIVYAARDRVSWLTAVAALVVFILARGLYSRVG